MFYLVSYQKQGDKPHVFVANEESLMDTVNDALKASDGAPVLISQADSI